MLLPHQVVPFLQHDDVYVRDHAADYLANAHDPSPATADDLWRTIDRFGARQSKGLLGRVGDLPQTVASFDRLLESLRSKPDEQFDYHLQRAVEWIDLALLAPRREEVLADEVILPHVRDHLRQRLELAEVPADALWDGLLQSSDEAEGKYVGQFDARAAGRLVEALARHGDVAAEKAMERLRQPYEDWMEIYCVQLLGKLRHAPASGLLIDRLLPDADLLNEEAVRALVRIGTVDVVQRLEAIYPSQPWEARLFIDDPLGQIKRPESEAALLRMLEGEKEEDLQTMLAAELCDLCTTEGLEAVRRLIVEDRYDPQMEDLPEQLLIVGKMVGYEPPEAAQWRTHVERRVKDRERRMKSGAMEEMIRELRERFRRNEPGWSNPDEAGEGADDDVSAADWSPRDYVPPLPPPIAEPIRRTEPKVGRNDPCPCGSGKKYKACCGRS